MTEEMIQRINFLAKKAREEGLNDLEKEEQNKLRREYIRMFRQGVENTMNNVYIVDDAGNKKKIQKKMNKK